MVVIYHKITVIFGGVGIVFDGLDGESFVGNDLESIGGIPQVIRVSVEIEAIVV